MAALASDVITTPAFHALPLESAQHRAIHDVLPKLVAAVSRAELATPGLAVGNAGQCLALATWARHTRDDALIGEVRHRAERLVDTLAETACAPALLDGVAGVIWALRHVVALCDPTQPLPGDFSAAFDDALLAQMHAPLRSEDYDLAGGLVGFGVYALEHPQPLVRDALVRAVVGRLGAHAPHTSHGATWFTPPDRLLQHELEDFPHGFHNLGLAHGVPGVIGFLARCVSEGYAAIATPLLDAAMHWLLRQRHMDRTSRFDNYLESPKPSRLAWCYGDPAIALVLWRAAQACGRQDWFDAARDLTGACAIRRTHDGGVRDVGLCHGSAGLALIFFRLWQRSGEAECADASRFWLQHTLASLDDSFPATAGCYTAIWKDNAFVRRAEAGFLSGTAGVLMTLLSLQAPTLRWDACLLTDTDATP